MPNASIEDRARELATRHGARLTIEERCGTLMFITYRGSTSSVRIIETKAKVVDRSVFRGGERLILELGPGDYVLATYEERHGGRYTTTDVILYRCAQQ